MKRVSVDQSAIANLIHLFRLRTGYVKSQLSLDNQISALCRRQAALVLADKRGATEVRWIKGDAEMTALADAIEKGLGKVDLTEDGDLLPRKKPQPISEVVFDQAASLLAARAPIVKQRALLEKQMRAEAEKLPLCKWWCEFEGAAALSFAQVIACTGDLSGYANPAKVWKRMGLAVIDGGAQRRIAGDAKLAIRHGFCVERRMVSYLVGASLIKWKSCWRDLYDKRKAYLEQRAADQGLKIVPAATLKSMSAEKAARCVSKGNIHSGAERYMVKTFLKQLWRRWKNMHGLSVASTSKPHSDDDKAVA